MNRISATAHRHYRLQAACAAALVALIALTGATWMTITAPTEPVVVLERVVITVKRDVAGNGTQVAAACVAPAVC